MIAVTYGCTAERHPEACGHTPYEKQTWLASTPDPDAPPCEFCGGGLAHFPECGEVAE